MAILRPCAESSNSSSSAASFEGTAYASVISASCCSGHDPNMPQDLPDDVWSQLAETWLDQGALRDLSLTSRRIHRLVVPALFRDLEFHMTHPNSESLITKLIRNNMRAQFLFNSPEKLQHTRSFSLSECADTVDVMAEYLGRCENADGSSMRSDAETFLAVLRDAIFRLIFQMPGLREIRINNTAITPLCYAAISSRPLLTSLSLELRGLLNITHVHATPALPYAFHLRELSCYYDAWTGNDRRPTDPYLADLLEHCILKLVDLVVSSILLQLVVSRIPLNHMLSLQVLSVEFPEDLESSDSLDVAAFFHVLRACPQLRRLGLSGRFPDIEPTHFITPTNLPALSTFSGTCSCLLPIVSGGTNLVEITIYDDFYVKKEPLTQFILSPPTLLRELSMRKVVFSAWRPVWFLSFIRSLAVFRNLESLDIAYEIDLEGKDYLDAMGWATYIDYEELRNTLKDLLRHLPRLRFLAIRSRHDIMMHGFGCPISQRGDPANRGHPSLEAIYVDFLCGVWFWSSRTGWGSSTAARRHIQMRPEISLRDFALPSGI